MDQKKTAPGRYTLNMALAAVAGQVGCLTIAIIFLALLGGLWLDNRFGTRPLFIVGLLLISVPVTVITMFKVVRQTTSRIQFEEGKKVERRQESPDDED